MPWNSSKSSIGTNHRTFRALQKWVTTTVTGFAGVSKRLHGEWPESVFRYTTGDIMDVPVPDFEKVRKSFLPPLPQRKVSYIDQLKDVNESVLADKPWVRGVIDTEAIVEVVQKQKVDSKNRVLLILLDSTLEIAFKDYLVNETSRHFSDNELVALFQKRHLVNDEIKKNVSLPHNTWSKLNYYYNLRCKLVHERVSATIPDSAIEEFRKEVHGVIEKLFGVRWPLV